MSKARFCVGCGKKYYPNGVNSYPSVWWDDNNPKAKRLKYARFHSKYCMERWLYKNIQAVAELVDNITICDNNITNQQTHREE